MKSKIFSAGLATAVAATSLVLAVSAPATASTIASSTTISVCAGNDLSTVDSTGRPLGQDAFNLALMQVRQICEDRHRSSDPSPLLGFANVVAFINTSPGRISFGGYANSVPYGSSKPRNELSCIYRAQSFDGHANTWNSCGYGSGTTSITTSITYFCPVPGSRWESMVSLYANRVHKQDAWATAIGV